MESVAVAAGQPKSAGLSELGAIGFALAGFTSWVLTDTSVKLVGQSGLPAYEMVAFLGLFMAIFMGIYAAGRARSACCVLGGSISKWPAPAWTWPTMCASSSRYAT